MMERAAPIAISIGDGLPGASRTGRFAARFFSYRPASLATLLFVLILAISGLAPLVTPYGRDAIDLDHVLEAPSPAHVLGTDELGRDLFTRIVFGGRFTILVALASVAVATAAGVAAGGTAAYFGGACDFAVSSMIDLFLSVPAFLVILVAAAFSGGRLWVIPLLIGGMSWMEAARVVRASALSLRSEGFVDAARSIGVGDLSIVFRHILPQVLPPVIVAATVLFAQAMLIESALSFLGFGVQPPVPTWGNLLYNAQLLIRRSAVAAFAPGFLIFITCLCVNIIGEGLRRALAREAASS